MNRLASARRVMVTAQSGALAGVERRMLQEVQVLRGLGMDVLAAPSRFPRGDQFRGSLTDAGAELIEWHPYKFIERQQPTFPFPQLCALSRRGVQRAKLDLAHVAMPWTTVGLSRVWALATAGVPVVLGLHCTYDRAKLPAPLLPYVRRALQGVVGGYAVSECVRQSFLQNFSEWIDADAIGVVHNGVDTQRFVPDAGQGVRWREQHAIPADAKVVVFCGRLDPFKNPLFALKVFECAAAQQPTLHLVIAGDGPLAEELRGRVAGSESLRGRVHMVGYVDAVERALQASDVYLSTSSPHEGFPLAPSEALASGLPILAPDQPVFVEAFGACAAARLVKGMDPNAWALALTELLPHDAMPAGLKEAARQFAVERLALEGMQAKLAEFYQRWS